MSAPSPAYFLGLDFGTSGARACVVNAAGQAVWQHGLSYPHPATQTPQDWRAALYALLDALPASLAAQLTGIALDGTSGTVLLCDALFTPLSAALMYHDQRAAAQAAWLTNIAPAQHLVCSATSGLAKFLWLTQQRDMQGVAHCLHQADWLAAVLCGEARSDYHNALKTGYDVENLCWPDWVLGLPHAALLPQVLPPGSAIKRIQPDLAARFGIASSCQIHAGTTDSIAAFIAADVHQAGMAVSSLGSTLVLKLLSHTRVEAVSAGVYSHRYGDLWLVGGASNAGGGTLRKFFTDDQLARLSEQIDGRQDSPLDYYPLPSMGERFPIADPHLAPRLEPRPNDAVAFLHGLLQGLSRIEAVGYQKLQQLGATPLSSIHSCGGGAKNKAWQTLRQRLIGVPVLRARQGDAAQGAAMLARGIPLG